MFATTRARRTGCGSLLKASGKAAVGELDNACRGSPRCENGAPQRSLQRAGRECALAGRRQQGQPILLQVSVFGAVRICARRRTVRVQRVKPYGQVDGRIVAAYTRKCSLAPPCSKKHTLFRLASILLTASLHHRSLDPPLLTASNAALPPDLFNDSINHKSLPALRLCTYGELKASPRDQRGAVAYRCQLLPDLAARYFASLSCGRCAAKRGRRLSSSSTTCGTCVSMIVRAAAQSQYAL